jgi:hypothetical protein
MTGLVSRREKEKRGNQEQRYPDKEPDDRKNRYGAQHEKYSYAQQTHPDNDIDQSR